MNEQDFDTVARRAAGAVSRRRSLLTLGGAAVTSAIAAPAAVQAGKDARKARKKSRKTCKRQIDQCRNVFLDFCASEDADCDEEVLDGILACCSHLSTCKAGTALDCFFAEAS